MGVSLAEILYDQQERNTAERPVRDRPEQLVPEEKPHAWLHLLVLGALASLLLWGIWQLSLPGTLPIRYVRITGDFRQLQPEQLQVLVTNEVRGGYFNVNVGTIRDILVQDPWIQDVVVQRVWPDTLRVTVIEQVPLARWGEESLLNSDGERFSPAMESIPRDLPLLHGPDGSEAMLLRRFNEIKQRLTPLGLEITGLEQDQRRSWRFRVAAGFSVVLGRKEFSQRIDRFVQTVPQALSGRLEQVNVIDMRYTNGFSVHWKQQDSVQESGQ